MKNYANLVLSLLALSFLFACAGISQPSQYDITFAVSGGVYGELEPCG